MKGYIANLVSIHRLPGEGESPEGMKEGRGRWIGFCLGFDVKPLPNCAFYLMWWVMSAGQRMEPFGVIGTPDLTKDSTSKALQA